MRMHVFLHRYLSGLFHEVSRRIWTEKWKPERERYSLKIIKKCLKSNFSKDIGGRGVLPMVVVILHFN